MRQVMHLVRAACLACVLALSINTLGSQSAHAAPVGTAGPQSAQVAPVGTVGLINTGQQEQVQVSRNGTISLLANAPPAPDHYGTFDHFGYSISPAQQFPSFFNSIRLDYDAHTPAGSAVHLDMRSSADGVRWSAWEVDLPSGAIIHVDTPARFAQYRATLLGNAAAPRVRALRFTPQEQASFMAMSLAQTAVAPTFQLHATRMGMVGGRTANGHRIKARDHYVSLPSWSALSSKGGNEYMVRITYKGRSSVAPVYDVGPWNEHDNYWDVKRDRFKELRQGWPQDHAAYFEGYNGGRAEKGRVRFPSAIDIGDGVWWDDLGIKGDRAVVEVTFLWLGADPLGTQAGSHASAPSTAAPAASAASAPTSAPGEAAPVDLAPQPVELVVDERDSGFITNAGSNWRDSPADCGNAGHSFWSSTAADADRSKNTARWQATLPAEAQYDVYAFIPACGGDRAATKTARYTIKHRDGTQEVTIDQAAAVGTWVLLGRFPFGPGAVASVDVSDLTGEPKRVVWSDAVKWVIVP